MDLERSKRLLSRWTMRRLQLLMGFPWPFLKTVDSGIRPINLVTNLYNGIAKVL